MLIDPTTVRLSRHHLEMVLQAAERRLSELAHIVSKREKDRPGRRSNAHQQFDDLEMAVLSMRDALDAARKQGA